MTQIDAFGFTFREINNGTAYELVKYSGSESRLKIPPAYNGKPILRIAPYAFAGCSQITDLVISEGIVEIGDGAFQNCTSLVNLQIPNSVVKMGQILGSRYTSTPAQTTASSVSSVQNQNPTVSMHGFTFTEINNGTAYELTKYAGNEARIRIPSMIGNKPILTIRPYAFSNNTTLTDVIVSNDIQNVGDGAFENCSALNTLHLPGCAFAQGISVFPSCKQSLQVTYGIDNKLFIPQNPTGLQRITQSINELSGGSGPVKIGMKDLLKGLFSPHTPENDNDTGSLLTAGTPNYKNKKVFFDLPKPWVYLIVFFVLLIALILSYIIVSYFGNWNGIPLLMILGSMLIPIPILVFLYECNMPRNVNIISIICFFLIGGIASLIVTLILNTFIYDWLNGIMAWGFAVGIIEEAAKALIVGLAIYLLISRKYPGKQNYILTGLLIGASIGAGFAIFETAGYAFNNFLDSLIIRENTLTGEITVLYDINEMYDTLIARGILSPGGHIIWAAIEGAALAIVAKAESISFHHFIQPAFLVFFAITVILHGCWDTFNIIPVVLILTFIGVMLTIILLFVGFEQVKRLDFNRVTS